MLRKRLYACLLAVTLAVTSMAVVAANSNLNIRLRDDCDQATFDAAVGDGTCVGDGDTLFQDFIAEFQQTGQVEKWRFNNDRAGIDRGSAITLNNRGGEFHTFTRVAEFGGGIIEALNTLPNDPDVVRPTVPECGAPNVLAPPSPENVFMPAGTSGVTAPLTKRGTVKFQCCIHPWMQSVITVK